MEKKPVTKLAFYKAEHGNIVDKAIAWWTNSDYSHVELVVDNVWYSTSPRDLEIRRKCILPKEGHWDFINIYINPAEVEKIYANTAGAKYDWIGIWFTQFFPLNKHSSTKYFCSEWCAMVLGIENPHEYSPEHLYMYMINKGVDDEA